MHDGVSHINPAAACAILAIAHTAVIKMDLKIEDDESLVKLKTRNKFASKVGDVIQSKGLDEAAAAARARKVELTLYTQSQGTESYREQALALFGKLKRQDLSALERGWKLEDDEAENASAIPAAKKRKLEDLAAETDAVEEAASETSEFKTGDTIRDKVREKITAGMRMVPERERQKRVISEEKVAAEIEQAMHEAFGDVKGYKMHARNIFANISAPSNPTFRRKLLTGEIPPGKAATLKADEMASSEEQEKLQAQDSHSLYHSRVAEQPATKGIFQCPKSNCRSDIVRFVQAQTRSGDEPMTTFCTCVSCDFRWKFS